MECETVAQFILFEYIKQHFEKDALVLEVVDESTIKGTDRIGQEIVFYYNYQTGGILTTIRSGENLEMLEGQIYD